MKDLYSVHGRGGTDISAGFMCGGALQRPQAVALPSTPTLCDTATAWTRRGLLAASVRKRPLLRSEDWGHHPASGLVRVELKDDAETLTDIRSSPFFFSRRCSRQNWP